MKTWASCHFKVWEGLQGVILPIQPTISQKGQYDIHMDITFTLFWQGWFMKTLNLNETSRHLGISKRRILTILKKGILKGEKIERTWTVKLKDVEEFQRTNHRKDDKITAEEAAKLLKVSKWNILYMASTGSIESEKRNGIIFIDPKSLL